MNRRNFLRFTSLVVAGPPLACSDDEGGRQTPDRALFPQSVASGDPQPEAIVLWTRAVNPDDPADELAVSLEVALDPEFRRVVARTEGMPAAAAHDHVIKVKAVGLTPRTDYHYRFRATRAGRAAYSPAGRTRTAPAPDAEVKVKLAFASCQDYAGRYYNTWQQLVARNEDLDFVIFLGDYIYETSGGVAPREVVFSEPPAEGGTAARSASNYRDIYRTLRSDPILQQVHERYPFVVIWDDHEYSNDCWGAHATYTDGAREEDDPERRRHAEQAFFEYQAIDVPGAPADGGAFDLDAAPLYPDARIYRELTFGAFLRLALTDYRSFRADHVVPEDAYPGTVWLDDAQLGALIAAGQAPADLMAVLAAETFGLVDIDDPEQAAARAELLAAALDEAAVAGVPSGLVEARAAQVIRGRLCLAHVNAVLAARGKAALPAAVVSGRGFGFVHLGKRTWFDSIGSRYVVAYELFPLYAALQYQRTGGASEDALGKAQQDWLYGLLGAASGERWTMVVGSVSMSKLALDLRNKPGVPPAFQAKILFNADQWDGFPAKKAELLARMSAAPGGRVLYIAGDIHASYASVEGGVPCLTTPAISSGTASEQASRAVASFGLDPKSSSVALLLLAIDALFKEANPALVVSNSASHGLVVLEIDRSAVRAVYHLVAATEVRTSYAGRADELAAKSSQIVLRVEPGRIVLT